MCYLFKGQIHSAKQKLDKFIETIQGINSVWDSLEKSSKSGRVADLVNLPKMNPYLWKFFLISHSCLVLRREEFNQNTLNKPLIHYFLAKFLSMIFLATLLNEIKFVI